MGTVTRELIRNPRELALYVELAQRVGIFNVVTSHALARRYLATIVQADSTLGDIAMQAIEALAVEMLNKRSLAVPYQKFAASSEIQRILLSHNVLHETQDGHLSFGHQTLLDVLVVSGAVRRGVKLNEFIEGLPPVPFVRPSIRSYVAHLAAGERREFRRQLRTVLTSNHAFHVRRLVAESLAEQGPQDEDWPLIRDLRDQHREVFQVIYMKANRTEWHFFWLKHLIPALVDAHDAEGLSKHVHRVREWENDDAAGVFAFWNTVMALDWVDKKEIAPQLELVLSDARSKQSALLAPLLLSLLELPRQQHSLLGAALAGCVVNGDLDDKVLWRYVAGDVSDDDVLEYHFDNKLRCQPHEFGNSDDTFLADRMQQSTALLDLAISDVERWSRIKASHYGGNSINYGIGFLGDTSYSDTHDQVDIRHVGSERMLMDAIQAGVMHQANEQSDWWKFNRHRLCFSAEGALRYFAILACTTAPAANLDVIGLMLRDKALLESDLSYELGTLMQASFLQLDDATQDSVDRAVLTVCQPPTADLRQNEWMLQQQAQLILTIPRHLRSLAAHSVIDHVERTTWPLVRQRRIGARGGWVRAPFSFQVFLDSSDATVVRLLAHYSGHESRFDDLLTGGEREVGSQLGQASSRHPTRFMDLLSENWDQILNRFRDDILDGVATYLAHRYGNLHTDNAWTPVVEADPSTLVEKILDELESHASHWDHTRSASKAIQACAHVIGRTRDAGRLTALAASFSTLAEEGSISGDSVDLITIGINMAKGNAAEALIILANNLARNGVPWPDSLPAALRRFAADGSPAIRALLLRRVPYLHSHHPDLGWELFGLAMEDDTEGLWIVAEPCLYYTYHQQYDIVDPWLARLYRSGRGKDLETWGRIGALAALSGQLDHSSLLASLKTLTSTDAWRGAASVWTHPENAKRHSGQCYSGLEAGLSHDNSNAAVVAKAVHNLFRQTTPLVSIPVDLLRRYFAVLESERKSTRAEIFGFDAWLNATSIRAPMDALELTEIYLEFVRSTEFILYDRDNNLTQLLTRLFAQAEEQEELDDGKMLRRVVAVQDKLLALGVRSVNAWLEVAERP